MEGLAVKNLLIIFCNFNVFKANCSAAFCLLLYIPNRGFLHPRKSRKVVNKYIKSAFDVTEGAIKLIKIKSPTENLLDAECFESQVLMVGI